MNTLKNKLVALEPGPNSVYIRRLAQVLPEIEGALAKGVTREAIVQTLREDGINVTLSGFAKALYRLRKKAKGTKEAPAPLTGPASTPVPPTPATVTAAPTVPVQKPFEPGDISAIARSRPDLNELARLGREAAAKAKGKPS